MGVTYPKHPTNDKDQLINILSAYWYNHCHNNEPESWVTIQQLNEKQLRMLFDSTLEEDPPFKTFILRSIKFCYGGGLFGPSDEAIEEYLEEVQEEIRKWK